MQMYIVIVSGSILNVFSTVHLNGHLTPRMTLSTKTCIRGTPCIKQDTTAFPEGVRLIQISLY